MAELKLLLIWQGKANLRVKSDIIYYVYKIGIQSLYYLTTTDLMLSEEIPGKVNIQTS